MDAFTTARTSETPPSLHVERIAAIPELPASAFFIDTDGRPIQGATNAELRNFLLSSGEQSAKPDEVCARIQLSSWWPGLISNCSAESRAPAGPLGNKVRRADSLRELRRHGR